MSVSVRVSVCVATQNYSQKCLSGMQQLPLHDLNGIVAYRSTRRVTLQQLLAFVNFFVVGCCAERARAVMLPRADERQRPMHHFVLQRRRGGLSLISR